MVMVSFSGATGIGTWGSGKTISVGVMAKNSG